MMIKFCRHTLYCVTLISGCYNCLALSKNLSNCIIFSYLAIQPWMTAMHTFCHRSNRCFYLQHTYCFICYNQQCFDFRSEWNAAQNKVFNRVYKALASERLSKLANAGTVNEPILRRLHVDKSAKRIRHIFSSACWVGSVYSRKILCMPLCIVVKG